MQMTERERQASNMLQDIARDINTKLPKGFGFCLLAYEFGDAKDREMLYVSNGNRQDVQRAMLEFCTKVKEEHYGKEVK